MRASTTLCLSLSAALVGCRTPPPPAPFVPPPLACDVHYFAGTVLSGPRTVSDVAAAVTPATSLVIDCAATYVATADLQALTPIATASRLIVSSRSSELLWPAADLEVTRVHIGADAAAEAVDAALARPRSDDAVLLFAGRGVLPSGVTARFGAASTVTPARRAGLMVGREVDGAVSVAVMLEQESADRVIPERQIALLEAVPSVGGAPLVIVVPSFFDRGTQEALVLRIALRAADVDDAEHGAAVARCAEELRRVQASTASAGAALAPGSARALAVTVALRALEAAADPRPLLLLCNEDASAAPLALDLALSGRADVLAAWTQRITAAVDDATSERIADDHEVLSWLLERTAFEMIAEALERDELPVELLGMLARHAGEAGCFPGTLAEVLARARDRADFERDLLAENNDFLEAAEPAARVRAFDWLTARGLAPEGFSPLASREERRAALALRAEGENEGKP